ncbi:MAG: hypothetical protein C5S38_03940 [Candidatus Methanophagaceae archaeon]|jgi:hypothetical protein|nr:MAG: hypothetical protein C5S38_03910 [Methanophagales archaeon]KAF5415480.1 MAG: hypothetical protein C5S38_03940 [Methanophagales archaeon]KAF5433641.1 hypothetical protein C5S36_06070 [Methanophagales archaeon]
MDMIIEEVAAPPALLDYLRAYMDELKTLFRRCEKDKEEMRIECDFV